MGKYAMYLNYTPAGKWVIVGSVPANMASKVFNTLTQAKKYATINGYTVEPNGKLSNITRSN